MIYFFFQMLITEHSLFGIPCVTDSIWRQSEWEHYINEKANLFADYLTKGQRAADDTLGILLLQRRIV